MLIFEAVVALILLTTANPNKTFKDKNILDYSEADFDELSEQWEENDEEKLPPDELPYGHPDRPQRPIDLSKLNTGDPMAAFKAMQTGKTAMLFVTLTGSPTMEETTELSSIWEIGLYNNHIQATRYVIEEDRVMFVFTDGSLAWEAKDFLISQERCLEVELDSKVYPGLGAKSKQGSNSEEEKSRSESKKSGSKSKTSGSKTTPPESEPARVRSVEL